MSLDTHIYLWNYHYNQGEYISIPPQKLPQAPLQSVSTHPSSGLDSRWSALCHYRLDKNIQCVLCLCQACLAQHICEGISVVAWISSFLLLSSSIWMWISYSVLSILLLVDTWAISSLGLLRIKWLWTFKYKSLWEHVV